MNSYSFPALAVCLVFAGCRDDRDEQRITMNQMVPSGIQIVLNPHGITPLAAAVSLETEHPSIVEFTVLGSQPVTLTYDNFQVRHDSLPLLGLYENLANQVQVKVTDTKSRVAYDTITVATGVAYSGNPDIMVTMRNNAQREEGMYLADLHFGTSGIFESRPAVIDADGKIRWQLDLSAFTDIAWPLKKTSRGTFMFVNGKNLHEYSVLGKPLRSWSLGVFSAHHDWEELPNGNVLILAYRSGKNIPTSAGTQSSVEDQVIEFNLASGTVVNEWDLTQVLDVDRTDLLDGVADWFHANSVFYDANDQTIIVSGRNQGVIKLDWNNSLKWILAPHQGWGNAGRDGSGSPTAPYLLTAIDANGQPYASGIQQGQTYHPDFDWPFAQHTANVLSNGNLMVFDNGFNRRLDASIPLADRYSRIVEYGINGQAKTVRQLWDWGKQDGYGLYSVIISSATQLAVTGNYLLGSGFIMATTPLSARIIELRGTTKAKVFDAELSFKNQNGNGVFGWGNIDIMYRVQPFTF